MHRPPGGWTRGSGGGYSNTDGLASPRRPLTMKTRAEPGSAAIVVLPLFVQEGGGAGQHVALQQQLYSGLCMQEKERVNFH